MWFSIIHSKEAVAIDFKCAWKSAFVQKLRTTLTALSSPSGFQIQLVVHIKTLHTSHANGDDGSEVQSSKINSNLRNSNIQLTELKEIPNFI